MCYFFGICSTYKANDEDLNFSQFLELLDVTKYENNPRDNMRYYEINYGGCACQLFYRRNRIISGNLSDVDQSHINDYSSDIKKLLEKLPGNGETEVLVILTDENNYSIMKDYELMRRIYPVKEIPKQLFIDKYPFIEKNLVYLLK